MKEIKVFIASSNKLLEERREIELFLSRKNDAFRKIGIDLKTEVCEKRSTCFSNERKQNEFNESAINSDVFICLIFDKVGEFTYEEFTKAFESFKSKHVPKYIYVFFKNAPIQSSELSESYYDVIKLKNQLKELGQVWRDYDSSSSLLLQLNQEIDFVGSDIFRLEEANYLRNYEILFTHDIIEINDPDSFNVFYKKYSIIKAKSPCKFVSDEFYIDGQIDFDSLTIERGTLAEKSFNFSRIILKTLFDKELEVDQIASNSFSCNLQNTFTNVTEFWQQEQLSQTSILKTTIIFPRERIFKKYWGVHLTKYREIEYKNIKAIKLNGRDALDLEATNASAADRIKLYWDW